MRVVFAGTPQIALPALEAVAASRHDLVGVVTRPDAPVGRGRQLRESPVAQWVTAHEPQVPLLKPERPGDPQFLQRLRDLAPQCCPVVAYGGLLPESALEVPTHGWVNLHFSLLPDWRGAAPVQRAIWAGEEMTGATTFRIVPELDAGPVYGVMTQSIGPEDTAGALLARLAEGGAGLLVSTLDGIEDGQIEARPQPGEGGSYAAKITPEDARVDWAEPAVVLDRQVRACTPQPGAWTTHEGRRMKLGPLRPDPGAEALEPGEIALGKNSVHVGTGTDPVLLGQVKPHGKRQMPAADWARGARLHPGVRLGSG